MRRLFEGGAYSSNYCNWQLKSLLHLGQIVITFRTLLHLGQNVITFRNLLHLGSFITFRPSTPFLFHDVPSGNKMYPLLKLANLILIIGRLLHKKLLL